MTGATKQDAHMAGQDASSKAAQRVIIKTKHG